MARRSQLSHWGAYEVEVDGGRITGVHPHPSDPDPSPLLGNVPSAVTSPSRVLRPAVRAGWRARGPGPDERRGTEPFVAVSWDEATALVAAEVDRVRRSHGNEAIFGGSYGWASAGRFHHAQTQLHRLLNAAGGFTSSVHTYSVGAAEVILPHVVGSAWPVFAAATSWSQIAEHTDLVVSFGGIPAKNSGVAPGGVTRHLVAGHLRRAAARGCAFELFSPVRDDLAHLGGATRWHPLVPGTDVPVMLALAHTLAAEGLADLGFLSRYTSGYDRFADYLLGATDGVPKTAEWAGAIAGIDPETLRELARRMVTGRTLVTASWSLQRAEHGEQPVWALITLAAMVGQIGLPGGGFGHGYGAQADVGADPVRLPRPTLPRGTNPVRAFIPVARIADMLLGPGEPFDYNGSRYAYPDIRLVWWAGGNPFHHHQDLGRLHRAFTRPDTVIVNEPFWTGTARHADIVLPATTPLERDDLGSGPGDPFLIAMQAAVAPVGEARHDFEIGRDIARHLGCEEAFTEGRDAHSWIRHLYGEWRRKAEHLAGEGFPGPAQPAQKFPGPAQPAQKFPGPAQPAQKFPGPAQPAQKFPGPAQPAQKFPGPAQPAQKFPGPAQPAQKFPDFEEFWAQGFLELPTTGQPATLLGDFRLDAGAHPLRTPSGRIEIYSERVASFGYADCPGHATWLEPLEWAGGPRAAAYPLTLIANQPRTRLHSQLDGGAASLAAKVAGREPVRLHPGDATARGIAGGDVVRIWNDRGACLAGAVVSADIRAGVVQLSTGAWYDPADPSAEVPLCVHGNPNVLTLDTGSSHLGQGCVGQRVMVQVERFDGPIPPVTAFDPPAGAVP